MVPSGPIQKFKTYLESHKATDQTIERYLPAAKDFLASTSKMSGWTKDDVRTFLATKSRRDLKGSYLRFLFGAIKALFRAHDLQWPFERQDVPALNEPEMPFYTIAEEKKILDAAARRVADATASNPGVDTLFLFMVALRDFLLLKVAIITGCRRAELTYLNREDYDPKGARLFVHPAKHGRSTWRKLDREGVKWLNQYLGERTDRHKPLFLNTRHDGERRLEPKSLNAVLGEACKRALVKNRGWHGFRRTFATDLYEHNVREKDITSYMGWKKPEQVFRYIQRLPSRVEKTVIESSSHFQEEK